MGSEPLEGTAWAMNDSITRHSRERDTLVCALLCIAAEEDTFAVWSYRRVLV